jgi:acetyl esterase/lipase
VGAGFLARHVTRRRRALEAVASDLRTPVLYAIPSVGSDTTLRAVRALASLAPRADGPAVRTTPGGVRLLTFEPPERARPSGALLWIHGGGLILGQPEQGEELCRRVATELGALVVSVDYRLAPEDPFPSGLDDCFEALRWLHDEAGALGIDPDRIAVGGDSAGGGLAAALSQKARDAGGPAIAFQLLEYPMLDDRTVLRTDLDPDGVYLWTPKSNRYAWTAYLGHPPRADEARGYAVPARCEELRGLPPAWIGVGDLDLFHDEDVEYARRLVEAGVACDLHVEPGMWHGADSVLPKAPTSTSFRDRVVDALRAPIGAPGS